MPHHVYHTRALVMDARASGEADATLELFTKDWGRIIAHARGLRKESSRLRFTLQPMSWAEVCVVRGMGGWRVTTANPDDASVDLRNGKSSLVRVARIVRRFIPNDISSPVAFDGLLLHTQWLRTDPSRARDWEVITLARLFSHLGYWGIDRVPDDAVENALSVPQRSQYISEINRILRTVHT